MTQPTMQQAVNRAATPYRRAKAEFDQLNALSKLRALSDAESVQMERAMKRMEDWGEAA